MEEKRTRRKRTDPMGKNIKLGIPHAAAAPKRALRTHTIIIIVVVVLVVRLRRCTSLSSSSLASHSNGRWRDVGIFVSCTRSVCIMQVCASGIILCEYGQRARVPMRRASSAPLV